MRSVLVLLAAFLIGMIAVYLWISGLALQLLTQIGWLAWAMIAVGVVLVAVAAISQGWNRPIRRLVRRTRAFGWLRQRRPATTAPLPAPEDRQGHVPRHPWLHGATLTLVALAWFLLGLAFEGNSLGTEAFQLNLTYLVWVVGALHFVAGIHVISVENILSLTVLGIPTKQLSGTFVVAPPGIFLSKMKTFSTIEYEFPDEPEKVYHGDEAVVPPGYKPPIRITFSDPKESYPFGVTNEGVLEEDATHRKVTEEVGYVVRWRILDAFDFERNIGTPERARSQMEDIGVSFLNENLARMTLAVAMANQTTINQEFEDEFREKTARWGIELLDGRLKYFGLSKKLNSAIQGVAEAKAQAQARKFQGEGEKEFLAKQGEGKGAAAKAELEGRGEGLKAAALAMGIEPREVLGAETARDIGTSPSDKIIVGLDGYRQIIGVGAAIADQLKGAGGAPASQP